MAGNVAAHTIPLSRQGCRLVLDRAEGLFRVAYYWPKLDARKRQVGENRNAASHPELGRALVIVLGEAEAPFDPLTVEHYIRSTQWGRALP